MSKIPAFLINRDRLIAPKAMVEYLKQVEELEVIIIDNNSTNPDLIAWYDTNPCIVHRLTANYGNCSPLFNTPTCIEGHIKPDFLNEYDCKNGYILSDPDLDLGGIPLDFMNVFRDGMRTYDFATKIGFGLRIDDLPTTDIARNAVGWEQMNISPQASIGGIYYKSPIDTTFAFYKWIQDNPSLAHDFDRSVRCYGDYQCRHLGWYYSEQNLPPQDEMYYLNNIKYDGFTHYSKMAKKIYIDEK